MRKTFLKSGTQVRIHDKDSVVATDYLPVGTFELGADCFSAAPELGIHVYNEDLYPEHPFMEQCESYTDCKEQEELNNDKISI
jgi:hypothetical protein